MPLPQYQYTQTLRSPVIESLFDLIIVTPSHDFKDFTTEISYINSKDDSIINLSLSIYEEHIGQINLNSFLRDIKYLIHTIYDKNGKVLANNLIRVEFSKCEINFTYNDSKVLETKLKLINRSCEEINCVVDDFYIKSLQRDFKINSIIN